MANNAVPLFSVFDVTTLRVAEKMSQNQIEEQQLVKEVIKLQCTTENSNLIASESNLAFLAGKGVSFLLFSSFGYFSYSSSSMFRSQNSPSAPSTHGSVGVLLAIEMSCCWLVASEL
jgi:hypothetical protein